MGYEDFRIPFFLLYANRQLIRMFILYQHPRSHADMFCQNTYSIFGITVILGNEFFILLAVIRMFAAKRLALHSSGVSIVLPHRLRAFCCRVGRYVLLYGKMRESEMILAFETLAKLQQRFVLCKPTCRPTSL